MGQTITGMMRFLEMTMRKWSDKVAVKEESFRSADAILAKLDEMKKNVTNRTQVLRTFHGMLVGIQVFAEGKTGKRRGLTGEEIFFKDEHHAAMLDKIYKASVQYVNNATSDRAEKAKEEVISEFHKLAHALI
ncbi:hypothetical protein JW826_02095 [Candidatus Woesearchaeota archaeon]|nr:hypothetical protein [Candidatus Woesearchaeota archaeon]